MFFIVICYIWGAIFFIVLSNPNVFTTSEVTLIFNSYLFVKLTYKVLVLSKPPTFPKEEGVFV